ncbi:HAD hydrolase family protein [Nakamurella deserti]|uniref:HAD hydrolase family protein n=1 Tax=Nakamurella deserti TaxID=2164074 RepID=UPI000DBE4AC0|nr:HAD hydrolase family protein [Nakamurella deserti]
MTVAPHPAARLIFLDFDGTYAQHGLVPAGQLAAVRDARAAGHRVFLCTGRPKSMIPDGVLEELDGFVAAAGGYVEIDGEVLLDRRFPAALATAAVRVLDEHRIAYLLEAPEAVYGPPGVDRRLADLLGHLSAPRTPEREGPADILATLVMSDDLSTTSFGKITYFASPLPGGALIARIGDGLGVVPSSIPDMGDTAGEIHLRSVHKAVGLQVVADHLGVDVTRTVAAGDGLNDLEMLAFAGVGIAIEGSDPRVLAAADTVAPRPRDDGLRVAFTALGLLDPLGATAS